ncbi:hypothetical protein [Nocardiopsis synnemataformans]|uniref:hypothetical protein n=1 Tax=Nocardiopsis synnemataformans TaxID=61305 RepID=UPI003EC03C01
MYTELTQVHERLRALLTHAHPRRAHRTDLHQRGEEAHPRWVFDERDMLTAAVNTERARRGLAEITAERVREVESTALGHIDYANKFTLRLAEVACGLDEHHTALR